MHTKIYKHPLERRGLDYYTEGGSKK